MIAVSHYGVHRTPEGIAYLHQAEGGENAVGVPDPSPFTVVQRRPCNHQIRLTEAIGLTEFDFLDDPLVQALAPLPRTSTKVFYIEASPLVSVLIQHLAEMSAPVKAIIQPFWMRGKVDPRELQTTNVQPLIITQLSAKQTPEVQELVASSYSIPRTILLAGVQDVVVPQPGDRITTKLGQQHLSIPWRRVGAALLKSHMREIFKDGSQLDRSLDRWVL